MARRRQRRRFTGEEKMSLLPRHWLEDWERTAVIEFYGTHDQDGYRRVT